MGFYEQIARYYDYIFPTGESQLRFLKESAGAPPRRILDVACGSGGYSVELAKAGYSVTGIDLDDKMIGLAVKRAESSGFEVDFVKCDMLDIGTALSGKFNLIFCIGNSIVHLRNPGEICLALKQVRDRLEGGGNVVLQTINYDRILELKVTALPTIKNEEADIEFIRNYRYDGESNRILFNTVLTTGSMDGRVTFENTIELFPLTSRELLLALKETGFKEVELYGDFCSSPYSSSSYMLVARAYK
jgi:SAM-dependent methyltransferase